MSIAHHLFFVFTPSASLNLSGLAEKIILVAAFVTGISLGSFLHTAALRLNRDADIVFTKSMCLSCHTPLSFCENLPMIGYLRLRGKCRYCGAPFSGLYFLTEFLLGLVCVFLCLVYPLPMAIAWTGGCGLMIICGVTDLDRMILHLPVVLMLGGAGFLLSLTPLWPVTAIGSILGMMTLIITLSGVNQLYRWWRGRDGFGEGDIWLMGAVGCWLGPFSAMMICITACFLGAIWGLIRIAMGREQITSALPFALFISVVFICWPMINLLLIV